jgi:serine/threonine protein kinase
VRTRSSVTCRALEAAGICYARGVNGGQHPGDETSTARALVAPGTVLRAKWTIGAVVERGPVITRYAATYRTGHPVLLDMLHESWSRDAELKASYLRASYLANRVDHPAVVRVLDDGTTEEGQAFVVTDRFEGETLGERARRLGGRIPRLDVYDIGDRLLDAVAAAHECGVVHGDLRPDRVILTVKGELRVTAFGSGRLLAERFPSAESMRWSPAEAHVAGGVIDARSDVWSIAGCLYASITGRFDPGTDGRLTPLHGFAPDAPVETAEAIDRALARDRNHRWQTARQMQQSWRVAWAADGVPEATVFEARKPIERPASLSPAGAPTPPPPTTAAPMVAWPQVASSVAQSTPRLQMTPSPSLYRPTPAAFPVPVTTASPQVSGPYATVTVDDGGADSRTSLSMGADPAGPEPAPSPAKSPSVTVEFPTSSSLRGQDGFGPMSSEQSPNLEALGVLPSSSRRKAVLVVILLALVTLSIAGFVMREVIVLFLLHRGGGAR